MTPKSLPLGFGELHAAPVVESGLVLRAEPLAPGLRRGALRLGDMGLELDRIRARGGDRIDIGVRRTEAAIVRLRHLTDDGAGLGGGWSV